MAKSGLRHIETLRELYQTASFLVRLPQGPIKIPTSMCGIVWEKLGSIKMLCLTQCGGKIMELNH
jgi:hypothetical protein